MPSVVTVFTNNSILFLMRTILHRHHLHLSKLVTISNQPEWSFLHSNVGVYSILNKVGRLPQNCVTTSNQNLEDKFFTTKTFDFIAQLTNHQIAVYNYLKHALCYSCQVISVPVTSFFIWQECNICYSWMSSLFNNPTYNSLKRYKH